MTARILKRDAGVTLTEASDERDGAGYVVDELDPEGARQMFKELPDAERAFVEAVRRAKEREAARP
jgi:hypothetical protein